MVVFLLERFRDDLRIAVRGLARARAFTAAAVLTLGVGTAAATAVFALVEGVLLRPLPAREPDRLLAAWTEVRAEPGSHVPFQRGGFDLIRAESRSFEAVTAVGYNGALPSVAVESGTTTRFRTAPVSGDFFRVLGVSPALGRALEPGDDRPGTANALVLSHGLWQRRYGGARDVVGHLLTIDGKPFSIVGVAPPGLDYPRGAEAWMSLSAFAATLEGTPFGEAVRDLDLVGRLRPGTTIDTARAELQQLVARLEETAPAGATRGASVVARPLDDVVVGDVRPAILLLFGAVGLVVLVASANVANLLLLRAEARRPELAVRAALGAGASRLASPLLAEGLLLALAAGLVGLAASASLLRAMVALVPDGLPRVDAVGVDAGVVAFSVLLAFVTAALAGLWPALHAARLDVAAQLRDGGRGASRTAGRGRRALVAAQVALAVAVVAAAGLLARSLLRLSSVDTGLAADRLVLVPLVVPYASPERRQLFLDEVVARLEATPGIERATPVHTPPFAGTGGWDVPSFTAEGQDADGAGANPSLNLESVYPGYFETLQVAMRRGRSFTADDRAATPRVAVVSADLAARLFPGADPLGRRLKFGDPDSKEPWLTIVGVADTTRYRELAVPRPTLYVPARQFVAAADILAVRGRLPAGALAPLVRERVREADPAVEVLSVSTFAELARGPRARPRFAALLVGAFAGAALLLSAVGLYAVMAASVRQRNTEIGVRVALGATPSDVRRLVLSEGLRLAAAGAAIGLAVAAAGGRLLRGLLYEIGPLDPPALLGTAALVAGAATLACALPARRAARADPATLLRAE
jgi:putative ABC transport system permease protein